MTATHPFETVKIRLQLQGELQAVPALDLLLSDETNPRSLAFQLAALEQHLSNMPGGRKAAERALEERIALGALSRVRLADVAEAALVRELKEELDIDYDPSGDKPIFCIWDRSSDRSEKHVALVYHVRIDSQSLRFATDRQEFAERGVRVAEIAKVLDKIDSFETWSRLILEQLILKTPSTIRGG